MKPDQAAAPANPERAVGLAALQSAIDRVRAEADRNGFSLTESQIEAEVEAFRRQRRARTTTGLQSRPAA